MIKHLKLIVIAAGIILTGRTAVANCTQGQYYEGLVCIDTDPGYESDLSCYNGNQGCDYSLPGGLGPIIPLGGTGVATIANENGKQDWASCPYCDQKPCSVGKYCPGGIVYYCPTGTTTSGTGAISVSDCNICTAGYGYSGGKCTICAAGTYKASDGNAACSACTNKKPENASYVDTGATSKSCKFTCNAGYYGATSSASTTATCTTCEKGYYCSGGKRTACGENMTTSTTNSTSADDCICSPGYEMIDGACVVATPSQTPCSVGISTLHVGDMLTYTLWEECESPALWFGTENGNCCANLVQGLESGALNINYNDTVYHAAD